MLAQERLVDARVVIEALQIPHRVEVREVLPADLVLGQQDEVVRPPLGLVQPIGRDVGLAAEDRLHPVGLGLLVKIQRAEQVSVVGDGHRLHPPLEDFREEMVETDGAIEKAILRVQMQVREVGHMRRSSLALPARAIQRKRIHSLSTSGRLACALALILLATAGDGCSGNDTGVGTGDFKLTSTATMQPLELSPNAQVTLTFILTDGGRPVPDQTVSFTTVGSSTAGPRGPPSPSRPASPEPTEASPSACGPGWPTSASRRGSAPPRPRS